jgi:hypothetical protein
VRQGTFGERSHDARKRGREEEEEEGERKGEKRRKKERGKNGEERTYWSGTGVKFSLLSSLFFPFSCFFSLSLSSSSTFVRQTATT